MTNTANDTIFPTARDIVNEKNKDKTALRSKVMQMRYEIKQKGFQKKGHNKYQNYTHYTIDDILEVAYPLLCKYNLSTWYDFDVKTRVASLEVTDLETGYSDYVHIEDPQIQGENSNVILQGIGKSQTYLRKYLYIQLLDISENDPDNTFGENIQQNTYTKHSQKDNNTTPTQHTHKNNQQNNNIQQQAPQYKKPKHTKRIPSTIEFIITELKEKNIKPSRKTIRDYTKKQLQDNIINQKEYNALQNMIQETPETLLEQ